MPPLSRSWRTPATDSKRRGSRGGVGPAPAQQRQQPTPHGTSRADFEVPGVQCLGARQREAAPSRDGVNRLAFLRISAHVRGSTQPLRTVICEIENQSNQGVAVLQLAELLQWDQLHRSPCRVSTTSAQLIRVLAGVQKIRGPALLDSGLPLRARLRQNPGHLQRLSEGVELQAWRSIRTSAKAKQLGVPPGKLSQKGHATP